ncbi:hypothetical protein PSH55_22590, partial [Pseudoalteromonas sp. Angola-31]|nr:hypothetical protein [Pseudoalteromonas sp. Angola-31]
RLDQVEVKLDQVDARLCNLENRMERVEKKIDILEIRSLSGENELRTFRDETHSRFHYHIGRIAAAEEAIYLQKNA